jgi:UDP-glucose 4-epimerase
MSYNILITGASGYLGGTLLARLATVKERFPAYGNLYALVRTEAQSESVKQYGAKPLTFDTRNGAEVRDNVVNLDIAVVYFLIDASNSEAQVNFIEALGEVGRRSGRAVHLLHVRLNIPLRFNTFLINDRQLEPRSSVLIPVHRQTGLCSITTRSCTKFRNRSVHLTQECKR